MPPYFLSFRTALAVRACPAFAEALSRAKGKSKGICFPEFSAAYSSRAAKARLAYSPERAPRSRGPSDSSFRAMSHFPCLRFRMFFAKAGRQSSPRPSLPKRRDLCHLPRFALKGHRFSRAAKALLVYPPSVALARNFRLTRLGIVHA